MVMVTSRVLEKVAPSEFPGLLSEDNVASTSARTRRIDAVGACCVDPVSGASRL
jgi:hypothetical protein